MTMRHVMCILVAGLLLGGCPGDESIPMGGDSPPFVNSVLST